MRCYIKWRRKRYSTLRTCCFAVFLTSICYYVIKITTVNQTFHYSSRKLMKSIKNEILDPGKCQSTIPDTENKVVDSQGRLCEIAYTENKCCLKDEHVLKCHCCKSYNECVSNCIKAKKDEDFYRKLPKPTLKLVRIANKIETRFDLCSMACRTTSESLNKYHNVADYKDSVFKFCYSLK